MTDWWSGPEGTPSGGVMETGRAGVRNTPILHHSNTPAPCDVALLPFLNASGEREAREQMERLLGEMEPVIGGILRARWRSGRPTGDGREVREADTAQDVRGEVLTHLIGRLNELKDGPRPPSWVPPEPIGNFRGFVATTTYRVCDTHLRKRYPRRACLKNRLRYLLTDQTNQSGFAIWAAEGKRLAGFAAWRGQPAIPTAGFRSRELADDPRASASRLLPGDDPAHANPADLVAAIFNWVGGPFEFDDLVQIVATFLQIDDRPDQELYAEGEDCVSPAERIADPVTNPARETEQRAHLQSLWTEIRQLSPRQATALLLNLRDVQGRGVIALFPLRGVATIREISGCLGMSAEQFAGIWNDLPMEDASIAELLGCTRQQVINLRKVARERLARRMKEW